MGILIVENGICSCSFAIPGIPGSLCHEAISEQATFVCMMYVHLQLGTLQAVYLLHYHTLDVLYIV